jgi:hypothetical protein
LPSNTSSKGRTPKRPSLDPTEIDAALDALSREDKLRLHAAEAKYRRGTRFDPGTLFEEACDRAKDGRRHCPKDVPFMKFISETMSSIAYHDRGHWWKTLQLVDEEELIDEEKLTAPSDLSAYHTPEDHLIAQQAANEMKQMVTRVHDLLWRKPSAQCVIRGWLDGLRGRKLRAAIGLTQKEYDSIFKRIRALMERLYPGWKP